MNTEQECRLAEKVVELCPEVRGMCRTADQIVRDPRVVEALVKRIEALGNDVQPEQKELDLAF